jgi:biotin carboxyl carrier protein
VKFEVQLDSSSGKKSRIVEIERNGSGWSVLLDGLPVDAVQIAPHIFSILLNGQSHEIRVSAASDGKLKLQTGTHEFTVEVIDPRAWTGRRHGHVEAEGRQQIIAPMPGKVVRTLVKAGDRVETGQGLFVVEAMKMQNEIRSPKRNGLAVNAGEVPPGGVNKNPF